MLAACSGVRLEHEAFVGRMAGQTGIGADRLGASFRDRSIALVEEVGTLQPLLER